MSAARFRVNGTVQAIPCPRDIVSVGALLGDYRLYACSFDGAYLCDGHGADWPDPTVPASCTPVGMLGCKAGLGKRVRVSDVDFSPAGDAVYAACDTGLTVTRCAWDAAAGTASGCADVASVTCPAAAPSGVAVVPNSTSHLVVHCLSPAAMFDPGILVCPLAATGSGSLAAGRGCEYHGGKPCPKFHQQGPLSFDPQGRLIASCGWHGYSVCDFSAAAGPSNCSDLWGAHPCVSAFFSGIVVRPSGYTMVACHEHWFTCGDANPTTAPSLQPTLSPTEPPSATTSAPSEAPRTGAPSLPPSGSPIAAAPATASAAPLIPTGSPSRRPSAPLRYMCQPAAGATGVCLPAASGAHSHTFDWANCSGVCPEPGPTGSPFPGQSMSPSEAPSGPSASPLPLPPPPGSSWGRAASHCSNAAGCQGESDCRAASSCVISSAGTGLCAAGDPKPDGSDCSDGSRETDGDHCVQGGCEGHPTGCVITDECRRGFNPQCGMILCGTDDRECHLVVTNNGQECAADSGEHFAFCSDGDCVPAYPCQGTRCSDPPQCRERAECSAETGLCGAQRLRPDGDACDGIDTSVASDQCIAGECAALATMRIAELGLRSEGGEPITPVVLLRTEGYRAGTELACAAMDGRASTDWIDRRLGPLREDYVSGGQLNLTTQLAVGGYGRLVLVLEAPVRLGFLDITDSGSNRAQAPTQVRVDGCALNQTLAEELALAAAAARCVDGDASARRSLERLRLVAERLRWIHLNVTPAVPVASASRSWQLAAAQEHQCYLVTPLALCGSCADSGSGLAVVVVASSSLGVVLLLALLSAAFVACAGFRWKKGSDAEPPPLTGETLTAALREAKDALHPLISHWRNSKHTLVGEMATRMVLPWGQGVSAHQQLRGMLAQQWYLELRHPRLQALPCSVLLALRLYSQEPQDVDRDMGWRDAPPPTMDSAGHPYEKRKAKEEWAAYKLRFSDSGGARNWNHYAQPNRASFQLSRACRYSSMEPHSQWAKYISALLWAAAASKPTEALAAAGGGELRLTRIIGRLTARARQGYGRLKAGDYFALPCNSSCTTEHLADPLFMGAHPGYAVLLRLHFPSGRSVGIDMRPVSMYPQEAEVLLPMHTVFRVTAVRRPKTLLGEVKPLPRPVGWKAQFHRRLLELRARVYPLLVVEAECEGHLLQLDPEVGAWAREVEVDAWASARALAVPPPGASSAAPSCGQSSGGPLDTARRGRQLTVPQPLLPVQPPLQQQRQQQRAAQAAGSGASPSRPAQLRGGGLTLRQAAEGSAPAQPLLPPPAPQWGALPPTQLTQQAAGDAGDATSFPLGIPVKGGFLL